MRMYDWPSSPLYSAPILSTTSSKPARDAAWRSVVPLALRSRPRPDLVGQAGDEAVRLQLGLANVADRTARARRWAAASTDRGTLSGGTGALGLPPTRSRTAWLTMALRICRRL